MFQKYNFTNFFTAKVFLLYGSFWGANPLLHLPLLSRTPKSTTELYTYVTGFANADRTVKMTEIHFNVITTLMQVLSRHSNNITTRRWPGLLIQIAFC